MNNLQKNAESVLKLIMRDEGFKCFYKGCDLTKMPWTIDYLDGKPSNKIENMVLACTSCVKAKQNDCDLKILANEKREENHRSKYLCVREFVETDAPTTSTEVNINQQNFEIAQQYLSEVIETDGFIEHKDALDCITMLCKKKTGTGSQVAVRRYLDALTSKSGPFMVTKNEDGKKIIVKRDGN